MRDIHSGNFGLIIAYLLPGFVALLGVGFFSPTVRSWLAATTTGAPTVGGFLYVTLGSLAAGLTVSTVRWAVIDSIHHRTGIKKKHWDYSLLQKNILAYEILVGNQYRFFQFYSNTVVAIAFTCGAFVLSGGRIATWMFLAFAVIEWVFWMGSRDTLRNYYRRAEMILQERPTAQIPGQQRTVGGGENRAMSGSELEKHGAVSVE